MELEHYKPVFIKMITSNAGEVDEVTQKVIIPRSSIRNCAKIKVDIRQPLAVGTLVNTLNKGQVFIEFLYVGLPDCFCVRCWMLGHNRFICLSPTITNMHEEHGGNTILSQTKGFKTQTLLMGIDDPP